MEDTVIDTRRQKILGAIDLTLGPGLEVGALCFPVVTPEMGDIRYVDWTTTENLREKYAVFDHVNIEKIVDVSYVWSGCTLKEAVGEARFRYAVLSHVGEHFPDFIGRMRQILDILEDDGVISMVLPDRRYTFDRLRRESTLPEMVAAHLLGVDRPNFAQIFDHLVHSVELKAEDVWAKSVDDAALRERRHWKIEEAYPHCQSLAANGEYHDVHCWVFTSRSCLQLLRDLVILKLLTVELVAFHPVEPDTNEFFLVLRKQADPEVGAASFQAAIDDDTLHAGPDERALVQQIERVVAGRRRAESDVEALKDQLREKEDAVASTRSVIRALSDEVEDKRRQAASLQRELEAIRGSTSWRLTSPLRRLVHWVAAR